MKLVVWDVAGLSIPGDFFLVCPQYRLVVKVFMSCKRTSKIQVHVQYNPDRYRYCTNHSTTLYQKWDQTVGCIGIGLTALSCLCNLYFWKGETLQLVVLRALCHPSRTALFHKTLRLLVAFETRFF